MTHQWAAPAFLTGLAAVALACWAAARHWKTERKLEIYFSLSLLATVFLLWAEPTLGRHVYFGQRRLLFCVPPLVLTLAIWGRRIPFAGAVPLAGLLALQAFQWDARTLIAWGFDADSRAIAEAIAKRKPAPDFERATVAGSWHASHSLEYYRRRLPIGWIAADGIRLDHCPADFFILSRKDFEAIREKFDLRIVERYPVSENILAQPGPAYLARLDALRAAGVFEMPDCDFEWGRPPAELAAGRAAERQFYFRDVLVGAADLPEYWTGRKPVYLVRGEAGKARRLRFEYALHNAVLQKTGPVRLRVRLNGAELGERVHEQEGSFVFETEIPAGVLRGDGIAVVRAELDKHYIASRDGQALGYRFRRLAMLP
jgi:hypothetical protein